MKKIYTFITAAFLAATVSVSAQRVSLRVDNNYEVKIDGRNYGNNAVIPGLSDGNHEVQLYRLDRALLGKRRTLVSTDRFEMRNNDVNIDVDQYGKLRINNSGDFNRRNRDDRNRDGRNVDNRDRDDNEYNGNNGRGYGRDNNPGRGNKYGHYKNKKSKKSKDRNDDRNDDRKDHRDHDRNEHGIHN